MRFWGLLMLRCLVDVLYRQELLAHRVVLILRLKGFFDTIIIIFKKFEFIAKIKLPSLLPPLEQSKIKKNFK